MHALHSLTSVTTRWGWRCRVVRLITAGRLWQIVANSCATRRSFRRIPVLNSLPASTSAWDQYWQDGRLASCGGQGGVNYQPVIAEGWRRFFGTLTDGAHVLDICTGNGAVARLAAEVA